MAFTFEYTEVLYLGPTDRPLQDWNGSLVALPWVNAEARWLRKRIARMPHWP